MMRENGSNQNIIRAVGEVVKLSNLWSKDQEEVFIKSKWRNIILGVF